MSDNNNKNSELRWDPLTRKWVIIAPARGRRPNSFIIPEPEKSPAEKGEVCPFNHGNEHMTPPSLAQVPDPSGEYPWLVRVVPNKYPVLKVEGSLERWSEGLYDVISGIGAHEVVIETPDCSLQFADLSAPTISEILKIYRLRINDLKKDTRFRYIMVFKNHGTNAGATLYHSHSQIIALPERPAIMQTILAVSREHYNRKERCIFCDIMHFELKVGSRVIYADEHFIAFCPFASSLPFEIMIMPRRHSHDYSRSSDRELYSFALVLKDVLGRLNKALRNPPYNFVIHTAPPKREKLNRPDYWDSIEEDYHWYLTITPRITRIAGFEWGSGYYINPVPPEDAALHLNRVKNTD